MLESYKSFHLCLFEKQQNESLVDTFESVLTCFDFHSCPINKVASRTTLGCYTCPEPGCILSLPKDTEKKVHAWIFEQRFANGSSDSETSESEDDVVTPYDKFTKYFADAVTILSHKTTQTTHPIMTDLLEALLRKNGFLH